LSCREGLDCRNQEAALGFGEDGADARFLGLQLKIRVKVHGTHQDWSLREKMGYLTGGGQAVLYRHSEVEDDHIRAKVQRLGDGVLAVTGLKDLPLMDPLQQIAKGLPEYGIVVGNQDSSWHARDPGGPARVLSCASS